MIIFFSDVNKASSNNFLKPVNEMYIKKIINNKQNANIFIGRSSCNSCITFKNRLTAFSKRKKKNYNLKYFNTNFKGYKLYKIRKFYNSLGVKTIPSVLQIVHGKIINVFNGSTDWNKIIKILK